MFFLWLGRGLDQELERAGVTAVDDGGEDTAQEG